MLFHLRISLCTCSSTNANAKPLNLPVFSFVGMFILHDSLRYLVDLEQNNSYGSSILVSKLTFIMYIFLGSFLFFLPYDCFWHSILYFLYYLIFFVCDTSSSSISSSTDYFVTVSRIEVCISRKDLIISSFLISSLCKKVKFL